MAYPIAFFWRRVGLVRVRTFCLCGTDNPACRGLWTVFASVIASEVEAFSGRLSSEAAERSRREILSEVEGTRDTDALRVERPCVICRFVYMRLAIRLVPAAQRRRSIAWGVSHKTVNLATSGCGALE